VSDPEKYADGADKVGISFKKAQLVQYKNKEKTVVQDNIESMIMGRSKFIITPEEDAEGYALNIFKTGDENDTGKEFYMPMEKYGED